MRRDNFIFMCVSDGKASDCNVGDLGSIPGSGRSPGEGNGSPFQYSCLENSMDGGAWQATVHGLAKSRTRLSSSIHSLNLGEMDGNIIYCSYAIKKNADSVILFLLFMHFFVNSQCNLSVSGHQGRAIEIVAESICVKNNEHTLLVN